MLPLKIVLTLTFFLCFIIFQGFPKSITGIAARAINTNKVSKNPWPANIFEWHPSRGLFAFLNNTIFMNVIRIDGAHADEYGSEMEINN